MLLNDDAVTNGQAEACPFSGRLHREERIEQLFLRLGRNAGAVVAYLDFDAGRRGLSWWLSARLDSGLHSLPLYVK